MFEWECIVTDYPNDGAAFCCFDIAWKYVNPCHPRATVYFVSQALDLIFLQTFLLILVDLGTRLVFELRLRELTLLHSCMKGRDGVAVNVTMEPGDIVLYSNCY